jgi:hypothetical protein
VKCAPSLVACPEDFQVLFSRVFHWKRSHSPRSLRIIPQTHHFEQNRTGPCSFRVIPYRRFEVSPYFSGKRDNQDLRLAQAYMFCRLG